MEPFELERSISKSSVDHKVEDLVELDVYDNEHVSYTGRLAGVSLSTGCAF